MSDLISGKEAYSLIGQGVLVLAHVQQSDNSMKWEDASQLPACDILADGFDFKIKQETILLNGIEVTSPFEPKKGEDYFYLSDESDGGYNVYKHDGSTIEIAAWRTEEEIKQVVAALRSIFNVK